MDALLIGITLALITCGQLLQKVAADKAHNNPVSNRGFIRVLLGQVETWWAIFCLASGMGFWLAVLYRMEVSHAYPFLGLGYVLVLLASRLWLKEHISHERWFGVLLIVSGIGVLSIG